VELKWSPVALISLSDHKTNSLKKEQSTKYAVITGASQGLGKAFALTLAEAKVHLILVSLPGQNLSQLAYEIRNLYQVNVEYYETDFGQDSNIRNLAEHINSNYAVSILINNAGTGGTRKFEDVSTEYLSNIIQVNVKATSLLTHLLLPNLKSQKQSYILNVSSIAAFSPVGFKTVYPASKTFVHSFSLGLSEELKDSNVSVSVINPGAMKTNAEITARIEKQGFFGRLTLLEPTKVARYGLRKMFEGRTVILVNPLSWMLSILLPTSLKVRLMTRIVKREISCE